MKNSHLLLWAATPPVPHIPACGACGAIPSTIHLIATPTWKDQCYRSKQFLKPFGSGSLTSRFLQHFLYCGSRMKTKGLNLRHHYVGRGKGSIYKHSLFSAVPPFTIPKEFSEAPGSDCVNGYKEWPKPFGISRTYREKEMYQQKKNYIFTINCSVVQTRTPCRL